MLLKSALGLLLYGAAQFVSAQSVLPSDISVALAADPSVDLQAGETVTFTVSVTNNGPEDIDGLAVGSSAIYDELDVYTSTSPTCDGNIVMSVVDLEDSFYFVFNYYPAAPAASPLLVGETRTCQLSLDYTPWAPAVFPITFAMYSDDLDPSNNAATVTLQGAIPATPFTAVPALSPIWMVLLACSLMMVSGLYRVRYVIHRLPHGGDVPGD